MRLPNDLGADLGNLDIRIDSDVCVDNGKSDEENGSHADLFESLFSLEELTSALNSFRDNLSPGLDKINYEILKRLPEFYLRVLLDINNDFMQLGLFPRDEQWRDRLVAFIPKNGSSKVRPIALASCALKLMEKIVNYRLTWLSVLVNNVHNAFSKGESLVAMFLDIRGAFDNVVPDILMRYLLDLGLPCNYVKFFENLIFQRNLVPLNLENKSGKIYTACMGLPQGCTSSPSFGSIPESIPLFSVYTSFIESFVTDRSRILQFADDVVVFTVSKDIAEAANLIGDKVDKLSKGLKEKNLFLSPEKCSLMIFINTRCRINSYRVRLNGVDISPSEDVKFLGMYLDRKLNWRKHINYLKDRCKVPTMILKSLR